LFQWLNSFESADSKKTLPCLGLIEYSPKDRVCLKNTIGSTDRRVLHRPVEPAGIITTYLVLRKLVGSGFRNIYPDQGFCPVHRY
jgi:hypothetical protein